MSENDLVTLWCLIDGEDKPFYVNASRNWCIAQLSDAILQRRGDLCAGINDISLWKVGVLLTNATVPANLPSKVTKLTSIDPGKGFRDRFPCPILNFSDESIVTMLDMRMSSVSTVFPTLAEGQLHVVAQINKPGK